MRRWKRDAHTSKREVATYIPELGRADKNKLRNQHLLPGWKPVLLRGHEGSVQHPEYFEGYQPCGSPLRSAGLTWCLRMWDGTVGDAFNSPDQA